MIPLLNIIDICIVQVPLDTAWQQRRQCILESFSKITIEICINNGVEGTVEVANPEENRHNHVGTWTELGSAERCDDIPQEERQPAEQKNS